MDCFRNSTEWESPSSGVMSESPCPMDINLPQPISTASTYGALNLMRTSFNGIFANRLESTLSLIFNSILPIYGLY